MPALDNFRNTRRLHLLNRALQILFSLALVAGLNYVAAKYFTRIDLTVDQQFSLSPETIAYLKALNEPVDILVTYTPDANPAFFNFVETLLTAYETHSRHAGQSRVRVEYIDLYQQRRRAQELVRQYDIRAENTILVVSGDRRVIIDRTELFEVKNNEITGFKGEKIFTNAILEVSSPNRPKIYFTVGHGEKRLDNVDPTDGLSELDRFLKEKNLELATLDLTQVPAVPGDAQLVIMAGPQSAPLPQSVDKLRSYLSEQSGRLLVLIDPYRRHGLEDLFFDWGILAEDMLVVDRGPNATTIGGDLVVRRFAEHPATQFLIDFQLFALMGNSRPIRPDPGRPTDERLYLTPLMASSEYSWGERNYRTSQRFQFDSQSDIQGPVPLAIAAERKAGETLGIELPGGRLTVFGSSDFISNSQMEAYGNQVLILNTIRWMIDREVSLNIRAREVNAIRLVISDGDMRTLLIYLLSIPGAVALLGILILIARKR